MASIGGYINKLTFEQLKPGLKVILYGGLSEGYDTDTGYCDIVTSTTKKHLSIKYSRMKDYGLIWIKNVGIYKDSPETRTWLLLENIKIEEVK